MLVAWLCGSNCPARPLRPPPAYPPPQALPINRASFSVAHSEWKKQQLETRMHVGQLNDLECPACVPGERALHGDGNQKLFTWSRGKEAAREPYYKDMLFVPQQLVDKDMKAVDRILQKEVGTGTARNLPSSCCQNMLGDDV